MRHKDVKRAMMAISALAFLAYYGRTSLPLMGTPMVLMGMPTALPPYHLMEWEMVLLINQRRLDYLLPPLTKNPHLMKSARFKTLHMKEHHYYSHTSPVYGNFYHIPRQFGHEGPVGEVLHGIDHSCLNAIVEAWLSSDEHRALLLHPQARSLGVGITPLDKPFVVAQGYVIRGLTAVHFGF